MWKLYGRPHGRSDFLEGNSGWPDAPNEYIGLVLLERGPYKGWNESLAKLAPAKPTRALTTVCLFSDTIGVKDWSVQQVDQVEGSKPHVHQKQQQQESPCSLTEEFEKDEKCVQKLQGAPMKDVVKQPVAQL